MATVRESSSIDFRIRGQLRRLREGPGWGACGPGTGHLSGASPGSPQGQRQPPISLEKGRPVDQRRSHRGEEESGPQEGPEEAPVLQTLR